MLGSVAVMLWLAVAIPYFIIRRKDVRAIDIVMLLGAAFVTIAIVIPDTLFA